MIKKFALVAILLLAVTMATVPVANAGMRKHARMGRHARVGRHTLRGIEAWLETPLTEEQSTAILDLATKLREEGATRTEIREAIAEMLLEEYGIEVPEEWLEGRCYIFADLTDEQREEIKTMVAEMKEAGKSRKEIRIAVAEKLVEWGIELPARLANLLAMADLAMTDTEIAAAPKATPQKISKITTWGKLKASR